ncbi:hydrogenase maturation nickel metallochaperone HypA [Aliiruegeria sabulilitoris]|uniref:hydrogenase maturation nickel metallochaperone HypA n=1 Tax=Aliiruegeria sabulilitoris TaxID=1510458 RepID=UPI000830012C|nr:hydrogenase maturation nickel metallochaperone HypA [Aliiruegeria sabulilitoris]NDR56750.1 hydrogenase maturation nickel metallochaperone HypA [Pseudoruegeria sp. M32A2M]
MHELAICQALIDQVTTVARDNNASRVSGITLEVGPLSGVVPDLLSNAFSIAAAGSVADGASLTIELSPVRVWCKACQAESDAKINRLVCAQCGDWRTELRSGDEMLLRSVVLEDAESDLPARQSEEEGNV